MFSLKNLTRVALIALAGIVSFYIAMQWAPTNSVESTEIVEPAKPSARVPSSAYTPTREKDTVVPDLPKLRQANGESGGEAFATLSWLPPPPLVRVTPPAAPPPVPVPVAPPLPFAFVGLMEKGGIHPQAFISRGESLLIVAAGDLLENNSYRVEAITAQQVVMTYLPLNTRQTLNISGSQP